MTDAPPKSGISDGVALELLDQAERIDLLDKRGAYQMKLHSVRFMQSLGIADEVIESLLAIKLMPADRKGGRV